MFVMPFVDHVRVQKNVIVINYINYYLKEKTFAVICLSLHKLTPL